MGTLVSGSSGPIPLSAEPLNRDGSVQSDRVGTAGFYVPLVSTDEAGKRADGVVEIEAINGASLSWSDNGMMLLTDGRQWAYSAEADINLSDHRRSHTIVVKLKVDDGHLGVGWLALDMSRWVSRASAKAGEGLVELRLTIPQEETDGRLVFDNWTPRSKAAKAVLQSITVIDNARAHLNATEAYEKGEIAQRAGRRQEAIHFYSEALRQNPAHMLARANLGGLRFKPPPQPFLDELRRRAQVDTA